MFPLPSACDAEAQAVQVGGCAGGTLGPRRSVTLPRSPFLVFCEWFGSIPTSDLHNPIPRLIHLVSFLHQPVWDRRQTFP